MIQITSSHSPYTGKDIANRTYYVYAHLNDGEPVYVGKGEGGRAWATKRTKLNHLEWMYSKLPENLEVQVIADGLTSSEAHSLEAAILRSADFKFNTTKQERRAISSRGGRNRHGRK